MSYFPPKETFTFHPHHNGDGLCDVYATREDFDALYEALSKTNQEQVVREFLEAIRPANKPN